MTMRRVDRIALDGSNVTHTLGRNQIPTIKMSYGDKITTTALSFAGSQRIDARTNGSYETVDGKVTYEASVFRALVMPLFPSRGFGLVKFPVVVGYVHPDLGDDSDLLENCRFVDLGGAFENDNKALIIEVGLVYDQVRWTNARQTINVLDPTIPLGPSRI